MPPWKAFVVQFSGEANPVTGALSGRVEHLNSSHRARFASAEDLLAVLTRMLGEYGER